MTSPGMVYRLGSMLSKVGDAAGKARSATSAYGKQSKMGKWLYNQRGGAANFAYGGEKGLKHPFAVGLPMSFLGADLGRIVGEDIGAPIAKGFADSWLAGKHLQEVGSEHMASGAQLRAIEARSRQLRDTIRKNIAKIASNSPQLYNELATGQKLPRGAIVLGGPPRKDLLEEVATMMAGVNQ